MRHERFSEETIIGVPREHEAGAKADGICRRHGIGTATFCTWRKKFGGMGASDAKRLRELAAENAKLERLVAEQMPDMSARKELLQGHWQGEPFRAIGPNDNGERRSAQPWAF
jgi:putative transposase